jgi:hypothetical protein
MSEQQRAMPARHHGSRFCSARSERACPRAGSLKPWTARLALCALAVLLLVNPLHAARGVDDSTRSSWPLQEGLSDAPTTTTAPTQSVPLHERQQAIRDRIARLEGLMLNLSKALEQSEPGQAQRLREALEQAGRQRIKTQVEQLIALLRSQRLSEADQGQQAVLADLRDLLALLTSAAGDADRRRAERQRLEQLKREIRALMDGQTDLLNRTRQVETLEDDLPDSAEKLGRLELRQRQAQQKADALRRQMEGRGEREPPTPGARSMDRAAQDMRGAAERLGEHEPEPATEMQESALEKMQAALTELEDALRQIRREEVEETLAALELRFRALLEKERRVRETVGALAARPVEQWSRVEQLGLAEAAEVQSGLAGECEAIERLLVDEGTTVILPELMRQLGADVQGVAVRLSSNDVGERTLRELDGIIALLTEILEAIETRRDQVQEAAPQPESGDPEERAPLLPGSAELKLIRSSQVRINERTDALASGAGEAGTADELGELAARQRKLANLARRLNERQ